MEFSEDIYQQIQDYLKGALNGKDLTAFEKMLEEDESIRQEVEMSKVANDLLYYNEGVELKEIMKEDFAKQRKTRARNKILTICTAVLLLLILLVTYLIKKEPTPRDSSQSSKEVPETSRQSSSRPALLDEESVNSSKPTSVESSGTTATNVPGDQYVIASDSNQSLKDEAPAFSSSSDTTSQAQEQPALSKIASTASQPQLAKDKTGHSPCDGVKITASTKYQPRAADLDNGQISIKTETIKGGSSPYTFSITGGAFGNSFTFKDLDEGEYIITIKDKKGCMTNLPPVTINTSLCLSNYKNTYSPDYDAEWTIPANPEADENYAFKLVNPSGRVMIDKELDIFTEQTWDGSFENGSNAEPGYYKFIIAYPNETCTGNVTLFR